MKLSFSTQKKRQKILINWAALLALGLANASVAHAETLQSALSQAYLNNPNLNAQRAAVRAADENIPKATSGYRPTVSLGGQIGAMQLNQATPGANPAQSTYNTLPGSIGLTVQQNLWNGGRTDNSVDQAVAGVLAQRETLRNAEQNLFQDAITYYMNVLRDTAISHLQDNNIEVLKIQLQQTQTRYNVGEVTKTDVAQAQAGLAKGQSDLLVAQSNLKTSITNFQLAIGHRPTKLEPVAPATSSLPKSLADATNVALRDHPAIQAAMYGVNSADLNVKVIEGSLYPSVSMTGQILRSNDPINTQPDGRSLVSSVIGTISVPIYDGGLTTASVRQAKEQAGQQALQTDYQREQVRAAVASAWALLSNSKAVIEASQSQVSASEIALIGIRDEAKVGQRTTLDVLNAEQTLLNARVTVVTAERDRVVASYALLAAVGHLSVSNLHLKVSTYSPETHYNQVKDKWFGLRTPDGR